jgi:hypothetical protein
MGSLGTYLNLIVDRNFKYKEVGKTDAKSLFHSEAARNIVTNLLKLSTERTLWQPEHFFKDDMRCIGVFGSRDGADASLSEVQ